MKKPEEIKKGLECCRTPVKCECCPYQQECDLPFGDLVVADALALIQKLECDKNWVSENYNLILQQLERDKNWASENYDLIREENKRLEAQNAELKRELDAAIYDLKKARECRSCKHIDAVPSEQPCKSCGIHGRNYEWRGPCEENGGGV